MEDKTLDIFFTGAKSAVVGLMLGACLGYMIMNPTGKLEVIKERVMLAHIEQRTEEHHTKPPVIDHQKIEDAALDVIDIFRRHAHDGDARRFSLALTARLTKLTND